MEDAIAFVSSIAAMAAFVAFIAWIINMANREIAQRNAAWMAFAARHGFTFVPTSGPWYAKKPARIEGRVGTVPINIDTHVVSNGKTSTMYTRLSSAAMQPMPLDARVYKETIFGALGDLLGAQDVTVGDAQFDKECVVKATREDLVRQRLHQLSSTAGIPRMDGQTVPQTWFGVLSSDAAVNPDFYDANVVLLNYCSSDLWSGDVGATPGAPAGNIRRFHFRGKRIVRSVIAELIRSHGLSDAREVFFMGSSAGGAGTLANIDETRATLASVPRFIGMTDGAFGVEYPAYDPATGRESAAGPAPTGPSITERFTAWNPSGDASCAARFGAMNIECNIASRLLATDEISTPLLVVDSQMDSNQLGDFGVNNPANASMQAFAQRYAAAKRAVFPSLRPQYGLFSLFSTTHVLINKRDAWSSRVGATTLPAAIGQWYRDPCARTVRVIDTP
jgi:hypothetical protein